MAASEPGTALPLYEIKAALFKALGHPSRVRILELLVERDMSVAELLPEVGLEPSNLSQQLAVLRRAGLVTGVRSGSRVLYRIADPAVAGLLAAARSLLIRRLAHTADVLADLRAEPAPVPEPAGGQNSPGGP
ncbi:MAG TPA: metalloregulator ArsR/SmtB family transcription factor [Kineosporiaceae bacterium]|nr:metalloregulator ArsR/SmtB family transcription factor [Kineosporiaceae bacterium]